MQARAGLLSSFSPCFLHRFSNWAFRLGGLGEHSKLDAYKPLLHAYRWSSRSATRFGRARRGGSGWPACKGVVEPQAAEAPQLRPSQEAMVDQTQLVT